MVQDIVNQKVIVLNGLARGGTNIAWNILQSHPNIVSPIYETNQIIGRRSMLAPFGYFLNKGFKLPWIKTQVRRRFNTYKIKNLDSIDNQYKYDGLRYTKEEIDRATLCIKGVCSHRNWDIGYSELFHATFADIYFIGLVRDGFAICESWKRRGVSPKRSGTLYTRFCEKMMQDASKYPRYRIVRFEDVLASPFEMARRLYAFVDEEKSDIQKLRIKAKKTLDPERTHTHRYGHLNRKYWFTKETIGNIIRYDINQVQQKKLSEQDRKDFLLEAGEAMQHFSYL